MTRFLNLSAAVTGMMDSEDDIKALENRLRTAGWIVPPTIGLTDQETVIKKRLINIDRVQSAKQRPNAFGEMGSEVKAAAIWLAAHLSDAQRPYRPFISARFGMSFDDAGRVVAEAGRLLGDDL